MQFLEATKKSHKTLTQRAKIAALIDIGLSNKEIADKLDMTADKVNGFRYKVRDGKEDDIVHEAIEISPVTVQTLVKKAKESGEHTPKVVAQLQNLEGKLNGIHKLDGAFHATMANILKKADMLINREDLKTSDLVAITNAVANAYSQIFNSKAVNVNVNNGQQISGSGLSMFKNSMRS